MKRLISWLLAGGILLGMAGCSPNQTQPPKEVQLAEFQLGERSFDENGTAIPFPLDGVIGVPEGENNPVVFILHGAHPVEDVTESRYYKGFSYLAEYLAKRGYLAVSININRAFSFEPVEGNENARAYSIFEEYRKVLEQANAGDKLLGVDIKGKADFTKLNFIGHSRGGDNGMYIAKTLQESGDTSVKSVMLVASPLNSGYQMVYTDVPTAVVLPQYDGDVVGLDSNAFFAYAYHLGEARKSPAASAFLYGGDHSGFNTLLTEGDFMAPPQGVTYLAPEKQQEFLSGYAADFLNTTNREGYDFAETLGNPFSNEAGKVESRYGVDFMPSVMVPSRLNLLQANEATDHISAKDMQISYVESSQNYKEDTVAPVKLPSGFDQNISLYKIRWDAKQAAAMLDITHPDFSEYRYLSLYIANDSTAEGNTAAVPLKLAVSLTDAAGNSASYQLNAESASALRYIETPITNVFEGMEGMPEYLLATFITPLGTQLIPLSVFEGIDLTKIASVQLTGVSENGAILLQGIDLYR